MSFVDGPTVIGQATADAAGLARFTTNRLPAGAHSLTARQSTTTSDPVTQVVAAAEPSVWFASQYGDYIDSSGNPVMQNIAGRLKDDEIEALAAYFATLKRRP